MKTLSWITLVVLTSIVTLISTDAHAVKVAPPLTITTISGAFIGQSNGVFVRVTINKSGHGLLVMETTSQLDPTVYKITGTKISNYYVTLALSPLNGNKKEATFSGKAVTNGLCMIFHDEDGSIHIIIHSENDIYNKIRRAKLAVRTLKKDISK